MPAFDRAVCALLPKFNVVFSDEDKNEGLRALQDYISAETDAACSEVTASKILRRKHPDIERRRN